MSGVRLLVSALLVHSEQAPIFTPVALVVLGGDLPLGLPLIKELENKGYIVITSVTMPHAVTEIESQCNGYVRALILDPYEVCSPKL